MHAIIKKINYIAIGLKRCVHRIALYAVVLLIEKPFETAASRPPQGERVTLLVMT
jgi:hypothetical protein